MYRSPMRDPALLAAHLAKLPHLPGVDVARAPCRPAVVPQHLHQAVPLKLAPRSVDRARQHARLPQSGDVDGLSQEVEG
jgi:hypothetical protein